MCSQRLTLVLLPGMDGTGELFSGFAHELRDEFEIDIVRFPDSCASYAELGRLVRSSKSATPPFVVVAESFSTPLAIAWAASCPANLKGLILCAGFATSPLVGWRRSIYRMLSPIVCLLPLPAYAIRTWLVGRDAPVPLVSLVQSVVSSVRPRVLSSRIRQSLGCDVRSELAAVTVPILFIQAKQDRLVGMEKLEEMKRIRPEATVEEVDGPHLLLQRKPDETAEVMIRFVREAIARR